MHDVEFFYVIGRKLIEIWKQLVQVNLCQKLLFLHHNMTTDCSLIMKIVSSEYLQKMLCTQIVVFVLFWHSEQFWYTTCSADVASFWKRFTCTYKFLNLRHLYHSSPLQLYLLPSPWLLHFFYLVGVAEVFMFQGSDYLCRFCLIFHFHEYLFLKCLFIWWCSQFILMFKIRIRTSSVNVHTKKWYSGIKIVPWTLHIYAKCAWPS